MTRLHAILATAVIALSLGCNTDDPITTGANNDNSQNGMTNSQNGMTNSQNGMTNSSTPVCGNGTVEGDEACDDGNVTAGDGCSATCTLEECGNGTVEGDEGCDDGNTEAGDGCSETCTVEECGNSVVDAGEVCDDGNTTAGDGCSADCTSDETCGNGTVDTDEVCDDGNTESGDGCSADCTSDETCGNGIVDTDEECDDGNTTSNDGCSDVCEVDCATDLQLCQMACFDTQTSNEHCGDCDSPCLAAEQCVAGTCDIELQNCTVSADVFPLAIPDTSYGLGQVTFDTDCSLLLVHGNPLNVVKVDSATGAITTVATNVGASTTGYTLAVVRRPADNLIYVSTDAEELYSVTDAGVVTLVGSVAQELSSLAIAPNTFGTYGGMLIGTTQGGDVVAVDETNATFTTIYDGASRLADLEFGPSGTLYIVDEGSDEVHTLDAAGNRTTVGGISSAGGSGAEGVAVSPNEQTLYVPAGDTDALFSIDIATGTPTNLANFDFDNGFFISGIVADSTGDLYMATGENSMTIEKFTP